VHRSDAGCDLIDLHDYPLPHLDERYRRGSASISTSTPRPGGQDRLVRRLIMITPDYNHSNSGVLKNAPDHLYAE
jgi:NAD(P)H-dependent FMN reductase